MKAISPCKKVCQLDKNEPICLGCFRSLEEIQKWTTMLEEEKVKCLISTEKRKAVMQNILG